MHNDYVKGYPIRDPSTKSSIITNHMTEEQSTWLTAFANEMLTLVKKFKDGDEICQKQVLNVLWQIKKYIERYPNPRDAAKAMSYTGRINHGRDEAIERGEGVRRNRYVGQFPTRLTDDGEEVAIDLVDHHAIDPATQAADRDLCRQAIKEIKPIAATGLALTAICGYDQGSAAAIAGVTRPYISRQMKQAEREMCDGQHDAA